MPVAWQAQYTGRPGRAAARVAASGAAAAFCVAGAVPQSRLDKLLLRVAAAGAAVAFRVAGAVQRASWTTSSLFQTTSLLKLPPVSILLLY